MSRAGLIALSLLASVGCASKNQAFWELPSEAIDFAVLVEGDGPPRFLDTYAGFLESSKIRFTPERGDHSLTVISLPPTELDRLAPERDTSRAVQFRIDTEPLCLAAQPDTDQLLVRLPPDLVVYTGVLPDGGGFVPKPASSLVSFQELELSIPVLPDRCRTFVDEEINPYGPTFSSIPEGTPIGSIVVGDQTTAALNVSSFVDVQGLSANTVVALSPGAIVLADRGQTVTPDPAHLLAFPDVGAVGETFYGATRLAVDPLDPSHIVVVGTVLAAPSGRLWEVSVGPPLSFTSTQTFEQPLLSVRFSAEGDLYVGGSSALFIRRAHSTVLERHDIDTLDASTIGFYGNTLVLGTTRGAVLVGDLRTLNFRPVSLPFATVDTVYTIAFEPQGDQVRAWLGLGEGKMAILENNLTTMSPVTLPIPERGAGCALVPGPCGYSRTSGAYRSLLQLGPQLIAIPGSCSGGLVIRESDGCTRAVVRAGESNLAIDHESSWLAAVLLDPGRAVVVGSQTRIGEIVMKPPAR
ncbi:MAG: hypothetical protein U1E65_20060 [Myxococcota bacterium]